MGVSVVTIAFGAPQQKASGSKPDIRFGLVASLTGDLRPWDEESLQGARMAVEEFDSEGGVSGRRVGLFVADSGSRPEMGKMAAEQLVSRDKVILLLGEIASGITLQMGDIAAAKAIPLISIGATRPMLNAGNPNMFRVCYTDNAQGAVMAKFAYTDLRLRKVALITDQRQPYSVNLSDMFRAVFTKLGGMVVDEQFYGSGQTDFSGQLAAIKADNPEGMFMSGYFNETGPIARQAADAGIHLKMLGGDGWDSAEILKSGGDAILGSYFCNHYNNQDPRPQVRRFLAKWIKKYGIPPRTTMGALAYDATMLACQSLKRAKTLSAASLRSAIANTVDFDGVTGAITLKGQNGDPPKRVVVVQITRNGQEFVRAYNPAEISALQN